MGTGAGRESLDSLCTILVGKDCPVMPADVRVINISANSATVTWMPANTNYQHSIFVNEKEYAIVPPSSHRFIIPDLTSSTEYRVHVVPIVPKSNINYATYLAACTQVGFKTLPDNVPDPPATLQVTKSYLSGYLKNRGFLNDRFFSSSSFFLVFQNRFFFFMVFLVFLGLLVFSMIGFFSIIGFSGFFWVFSVIGFFSRFFSVFNGWFFSFFQGSPLVLYILVFFYSMKKRFARCFISNCFAFSLQLIFIYFEFCLIFIFISINPYVKIEWILNFIDFLH